MTESVRPPVTQNSPPPIEHAQHERLLVSRFFDDDEELTREERLLASALVRTCLWCAALGPEIEQVKAATRSWTVAPRQRDFRLTPADVRRARSRDMGSLWDRIAATLRTDLIRPLAGAAVALGITLAVIGGVPYLNQHGSTPAPASQPAFAAETAPSNTRIGPQVATATPAPIPPTPQPTPPRKHAKPTPTPGAEANTSSETPSINVDVGAATQPAGGPGSTQFAATNATATQPGLALATTGAATPVPAANQVGGGGTATTPTAGGSAEDRAEQPLPPLLIFGVLLAIVGLLVVGLTVVARRMEPNGN
jgi:hypothetical protein